MVRWGFVCVCLGCGGADAGGPPDGAVEVDAQEELDTRVDVAAETQADVAAETQVDVAAETLGDVAAETLVEVRPSGQWFTQLMAWERPVAGMEPHARSEAMIAALAERGGWGNSDRFQIDFSITVLAADGAAYRPFEPNGDFYEGDCDHVAVPVPVGGALEGEEGYACTSDGDCHLIVRDGDTLFEMWRAHIDGGDFEGGCLAVWDLARTWPEALRGEGCTSADAAGLPIAPLLFTADEVAAGEIRHAIRFILPNTRIAHRQYVRPATHATGAASADPDGMPYGVRLRLRANYPLNDLTPAARVVAKALQTYGMILADGGQIALTAASDRDSTAKWDGLLGPRDLAALDVTDFDVVDMGLVFDWTGDCERTP